MSFFTSVPKNSFAPKIIAAYLTAAWDLIRAGKKPRFFYKKFLGFWFFRLFRFFRFRCTNMTGHKIPTQEEHPTYLYTHYSLCRTIFYKYKL